MDFEIDMIYEVEKEFLPEQECVKTLISAILKEHEAIQAEVSVAFVNEAEIIELNRRFFNKSTTTDVIAFDLLEEREDLHLIKYNDLPKSKDEFLNSYKFINKTVEGEIIVNADQAEKVSVEYGNTAYHETMLYIIHGLLHILGYDDLETDAKKVMWTFQDYYFDKYVINLE